MKKLTILLIGLLTVATGWSQNHWNPNVHQFPTNMNIVGALEINGMEQQTNDIEIGLFCNDECRGSQRLYYYGEPVLRYLFFITAYGEPGNQLTFRLFDHFTGQEVDAVSENVINYQPNGIIGSIFDPYIFSFVGGNCQVTLEAVPAPSGTVDGPTMVPCGTRCTVIATPVEEASFLGWTMNGDTISHDMEYQFTALADIHLVGHFTVITETLSFLTEASIYPNPTQGVVWIADDVWMEGTVVTVYDVRGQRLLTSTSPKLNLSHLPDGMYLVRVGDGRLQKLVLRR